LSSIAYVLSFPALLDVLVIALKVLFLGDNIEQAVLFRCSLLSESDHPNGLGVFEDQWGLGGTLIFEDYTAEGVINE
jgi:hypothetical protein